jgi:two-component system chemotaxis response regulator CheY
MKILSVDDSAATRQFIKRAIDVLGFEFIEAENGQEALKLLEQEPELPNLVLLDWHMPVMDGMELLTILKQDDRLKHIPVTMVTTELKREHIENAIDQGVRNYLVKPFLQEDLISKVMEGLGMGL